MQLNLLKINHYKNLSGLEIDFSKTKGVAVLAGLNGTGKSNLLECLALLLSGKAGGRIDIDAELSFLENGHEYHTRVQSDELTITADNEQSVRVVSLYSGSAMRMHNILAIQPTFFDATTFNTQREVNNRFLSIACIALFCLASERPTIKRFLTERLALRKITSVTLVANLEELNGAEGEHYRKLKRIFKTKRATCSWLLVKRTLGAGMSVYRALEEFSTSLRVRVVVQNGSEVDIEDLSEGEQRLLLLRFIYEILTNEKSLILLDEPDAYLHESWKRLEYDEISQWGAKGRMTLLTTHSPLLIDTIESKRLFLFSKKDNGKVAVTTGDKIDAIKELTGRRMAFFTTNPIVLFEGKYDISYVRRAFDGLKREKPKKYADMDLDLLCYMDSCGGASDIPSRYQRYRLAFPNRPIIVFYDHDNGEAQFRDSMAYHFGINGDAAQKIEGLAKNFVLPLPPPARFKRAKFKSPYEYWAIEDYIGKRHLDGLIKSVYLRKDSFVSHKTIPDIKKIIKQDMGQGKLYIPDSQWRNFAPLIDKLIWACKRATVVPFKPRPVVSISWLMNDDTPQSVMKIGILASLNDVEIFLGSKKFNVKRSAAIVAQTNGDNRFKLIAGGCPSDDDLNGRYSLKIDDVIGHVNYNLSECVCRSDGDSLASITQLKTTFENPKLQCLDCSR